MLSFKDCSLAVKGRKHPKYGHDTPGTWNMTEVGKLLEVKEIPSIICIIRLYLNPDNTKSIAWLEDRFLDTVKEQFGTHGLNFDGIKVGQAEIPRDYQDKTIASRTKMGKNLDKAWGDLKKPPFVLIQLPKKDFTIYANLKWGDCHAGVRTVCIRSEKFETMATDLNMISNIA